MIARMMFSVCVLLTATIAQGKTEPKPEAKPEVKQDTVKPQAGGETKVQGQLTGQVTWSGRVLVTGDVEVTDKASLLIRAGTVVTIAKEDGGRSGWNPNFVEIQVRGRLLVEGRPDAPVMIGPEGMEQTATLKIEGEIEPKWHGIVLHPRPAAGDDRHTIRGAVIAHAFAAIQVPADAPLIEDCVFAACGVGVEAGSAYKSLEYAPIRKDGSPEVRMCRFVQCFAGVYASGNARPDVHRCVFFRCRHGAGNRRPGVTTPLEAPGVSLVHCALIENNVAVIGSVLTRDSIFANNSVALLMSPFHSPHGTNIDGMSIRACLFHANGMDSQGDRGMQADLLQGDPAFTGPLENLMALTPTLPPALKLGANSAALRKGSGGRDLGPMVSVQAEASIVHWQPSGTLVKDWLAAPSSDSAEATWRAAKEYKRGGKIGKSFFASVSATDGLVDLRNTFGNERAGWLALKLTSEQAADATIEVNGDIEQFDYSVNGAGAKSVPQRRRMSETGASYPIKLKAGSNTLAVYVKGFGNQPRFGLSLAGSWQPDAEEPAAEVSFLSSRAYALKGERFIEVTFTPGLHWDNGLRRDALTLQHDELDVQGSAAVRVTALDKLLIGPLPNDWNKGTVELKFADIRNLAGQPSTGIKTTKLKL